MFAAKTGYPRAGAAAPVSSDLVIVGEGSGGYVAPIRAAQARLPVPLSRNW